MHTNLLYLMQRQGAEHPAAPAAVAAPALAAAVSIASRRPMPQMLPSAACSRGPARAAAAVQSPLPVRVHTYMSLQIVLWPKQPH
eukprot:1160533-Pelagomonas_calceolata.AAC.21